MSETHQRTEEIFNRIQEMQKKKKTHTERISVASSASELKKKSIKKTDFFFMKKKR